MNPDERDLIFCEMTGANPQKLHNLEEEELSEFDAIVNPLRFEMSGWEVKNAERMLAENNQENSDYLKDILPYDFTQNEYIPLFSEKVKRGIVHSLGFLAATGSALLIYSQIKGR